MGSKKKRELESNAEVEEKDEVGSLVRERSRPPDDGGLVDLSYTLLLYSPARPDTERQTSPRHHLQLTHQVSLAAIHRGVVDRKSRPALSPCPGSSPKHLLS
ncbi:hypothetical protein C8034_v011845 [Colletotrichum sidae]|uniref:Uncharacterized protein n=1 Tax=Colletotrichum sidae TaxID=1347389 RepID=A0A4R8TH23_9PEZI|nr:hypothetical protein C8034_v011845 [Colletotrichum sidae]